MGSTDRSLGQLGHPWPLARRSPAESEPHRVFKYEVQLFLMNVSLPQPQVIRRITWGRCGKRIAFSLRFSVP